jgi:alpha-mannosidase
MSAERIPLYYTFGNHMHWVDMEWLWGYGVLPGSTRDMLALCEAAGVKGNVNFDAVGYEKLASEAPEALAALREAVRRGQIEVVGASYGQPYGLFHGGESNVRQRTYGVRAVLRLLGARPRTFWEEEFDFFPQLPQILGGAGYRYASLFFQWTWHTPEVPREQLPAIWWEGLDGTRLLAAPRSPLNLHQWPEDFAGLLDSPLLREMPVPGIVQWLELMPSPDWMCRSEVILPPLAALLADPRFEIRPVTLSEYLRIAEPHAEPRHYTLDDVFHGMSLGKNGDLFRRWSRRAEQSVLAAESLSALAGLFGRPYPSWNVYPAWELEEAWRELLAAQHHDNDECEGLCGFVGLRSYERSVGLSEHVTYRTTRAIARRTPGPAGRLVAFNPLGWTRDCAFADPASGAPLVARSLPPFGYAVLEPSDAETPAPVHVAETEATITLSRGRLAVTADRSRGVVTQLTSREFPNGALRADTPLADLRMTRDGEPERFTRATSWVEPHPAGPRIVIERAASSGETIRITVALCAELEAVDISYDAERVPRPDGRMHAALQTALAVNLADMRLIHDHPYGASEVRAEGVFRRKYPTGDWMTSPQVFEEVRHPFTALQFLDIGDETRGLLYLHDGSQAFFRDGERVLNILSMYDPWDEDYFVEELHARVRIVPHGPIDHARRWRLAQEFTRPALVVSSDGPGGDIPASFGTARCDAAGVALTALFRETEEAGAGIEGYAGAGMGFPYVLRLVELNGEQTRARVSLPGSVAAAYRANLLGEHPEPLAVTEATEGAGPGWSQVEVALRPYEIATLYLDLELGRKVNRDLDAHRGVWATVHRVEHASG